MYTVQSVYGFLQKFATHGFWIVYNQLYTACCTQTNQTTVCKAGVEMHTCKWEHQWNIHQSCKQFNMYIEIMWQKLEYFGHGNSDYCTQENIPATGLNGVQDLCVHGCRQFILKKYLTNFLNMYVISFSNTVYSQLLPTSPYILLPYAEKMPQAERFLADFVRLSSTSQSPQNCES